MPRPPPPPSSDDDLYDLAPVAPAAPAPPAPVKPQRPTPQPVLSYRAPREEAAASSDPETIKNLWMPLWLLGGGVVVNVIAAYLKQRSGTVDTALMQVGAQLIVGTIMMLLGVLIAVKFRGIELGRFWPAVLKLAAVSVAPSAVAALASPALAVIPLGILLGWAIEFGLYFALLGVFFDLDESDTWYLVAVIFLLDLSAYFLIRWLI